MVTEAEFNAEEYLALNPDVAESGMDPWQHYQQYGEQEGRMISYAQAEAAQELEALRQNPGQLRDVAENIPITIPEGEGIVPLAYTLATGTELDLPDYEVAALTPDQRAAFRRSRRLQGVYDPYLRQGYQSTMRGIGAMGSALRGTDRARRFASESMGRALRETRGLAGDIPGAVRPGTQALRDARRSTIEAASSSDPAVQAAYRQMQQSQGRLGQLPGQVSGDLQAATQGALDVARQASEGGLGEAASRARASTARAQRALQGAGSFGLSAARSGIGALRGSSDMYDPSMLAPFMNQYEDVAVQQALQDIARQGDIERQQVAAQAVGAGAFGGSRQAIAEQELFRNILQQQGRTAAQMRQAGFESAAQRSQQAFEDARARQLAGAQATGQLGQMGAGAATSAAQGAGQLGLGAEQLAQTGAVQGAQLGMSARELQGQLGLQQGQFGLSTEQARQQAAATGAGLMQSQAQQEMSGAQQAGNLGLNQANLGLQGIQAGLGAQQQAAGIGQQRGQLALGAQQQLAGIGQGIAGLGQQQLGFGQAAQQLGQQDISMGLQVGQQLQAQRQAVLDARRLNEYQQAMMPYQQLAFASDITTGAPTGITSVMSQPVQSPSAISQLGGLALGAGMLFGRGGPFGGT